MSSLKLTTSDIKRPNVTTSFLELIIAIRERNIIELEKAMKDLNVNPKQAIELFIITIDEVKENNSDKDLIISLISGFKIENPIGHLLRSKTLEIENVIYVIETLNLSFYDCFIELASIDQDDDFTFFAISKLTDNIFDLQTIDIYEMCLRFIMPTYTTFESNNPEIEVDEEFNLDSFDQRILYDQISHSRSMVDFATIPKYLVEYDGSEAPYAVDNEDLRLPTPEEAVKMLIKNLTKDTDLFDKNQIKTTKLLLLQNYEDATSISMKINMLLPVITYYLDQDDDVERFRHYGPMNPFLSRITFGQSLEDAGRMLTCTLYDDVDEFSPDWFTETCSYCEKTIVHKSYAVRIPEVEGGWSGCFCSFKHAEESLFNDIDEEEKNNEILKLFNDNHIKKYFIDYFKEKINEIGIYDL
jgi:hypothetical protein